MGLDIVERLAALFSAWAWHTASFVWLLVGLGAIALIHRSVRMTLRTNGTALVLERVVERAMIDDDGPPHLPSMAIIEAAHHASRAVVDVGLPLLADTLAAAVGLLLVVRAKESLVLPAIALSIVTLGLAVGKLVTRPSDDAFDNYLATVAKLGDALDGRRELLASGASGTFAGQTRASIARWRKSALMSDLHRAIVSRLPMLAAVGVALMVLLPHRFEPTVIQHTAVLAVVSAFCVGMVRNVHELSNLKTRLAPLMALFGPTPIPIVPAETTPRITHIAWRDVTVVYGDRVVLSNVTFDVSEGETVAVEGPNGAGKTTLLEVALGLRKLTKGQFLVGDRDLRQVLASLRSRVHYVPQRPYLLPERSVRAAMLFPPRDVDDEGMRRALERVGLWERLETFSGDPLAAPTDRLSAGERQRLALARILCEERDVYLLDEPDANLDAEGVEWVVRLLGSLASTGKLVIVAAHTRELIAAADRVVRLDGGRAISIAGRGR